MKRYEVGPDGRDWQLGWAAAEVPERKMASSSECRIPPIRFTSDLLLGQCQGLHRLTPVIHYRPVPEG